MPELPEVEVVRRGLAAQVVGRTITRVVLRGPRVARRHLPGPADLAARLSGALVHSAQRRGKYLWLVVQGREDDPEALVLHLGMSGQLLIAQVGAPEQRHLHAALDLAGGRHGPGAAGAERTQLRFVDQRTFGGLFLADLVPDPAATAGRPHRDWGVPQTISHIAPDPLEAAYDRGGVVRRLKARHTAIKRALLDQGLVSGIGNIYADEALWRARVHGEREASSLSRPVLTRLLDAATAVMGDALAQGGTSFDALYVDVDGRGGWFERSLDAYGREGRPCHRCGAPIRREPFMNRSSFSCPRCQPRPRRR